ncbi:hypothetical protein GJAV_G00249530 [Gymnothorax javanicus]|nr:hypothetical protein GJAV_G00249530 [Gymnothorax javanicus]
MSTKARVRRGPVHRIRLLRTGSGEIGTSSIDPEAHRGVSAQTLNIMSDIILTFQVQLSAVMETVLKSAMYEITRLVEDSFMEEVARSKQEVDALRQQLQWSESKHREREDGEQTRCMDCSRVRASSKRTKDRSSGRGAEGAPPLPLSKGCSEPEWSPSVRQDTAPSSGSLLPEQQSSRQGRGASCGSYELEVGQEGLSVAGRQRSDPHLQRLSWTAFKLGDSDSEAEGPDPSCASVPEPASPPTRREPQPRPAEEGVGLSASPLQHLSVKSEGGVPEAPLVKEEVELQPVCREEMDLDTAHGESWDRGDLQFKMEGFCQVGRQRGRTRKSNAQRQREYRARVKQDPAKYLERRTQENLRCKMFRQRRSEEKVAWDRKMARLRMRAYRWRKKQTRGGISQGLASGAVARPSFKTENIS